MNTNNISAIEIIVPITGNDNYLEELGEAVAFGINCDISLRIKTINQSGFEQVVVSGKRET